MGDMSMDSMPGMMPARPFGIPMNRMGSGTAWLPDGVRHARLALHGGMWMLMVHATPSCNTIIRVAPAAPISSTASIGA